VEFPTTFRSAPHKARLIVATRSFGSLCRRLPDENIKVTHGASAASTFQIVRTESELVNPIPQLRILNEHQTVDMVAVQKTNVEL
jgi:hypothetical protein